MLNKLRNYPFSILVIIVYSLGYLAQAIECHYSTFCFMSDSFADTGFMFYWTFIIACELYHNVRVFVKRKEEK